MLVDMLGWRRDKMVRRRFPFLPEFEFYIHPTIVNNPVDVSITRTDIGYFAHEEEIPQTNDYPWQQAMQRVIEQSKQYSQLMRRVMKLADTEQGKAFYAGQWYRKAEKKPNVQEPLPKEKRRNVTADGDKPDVDMQDVESMIEPAAQVGHEQTTGDSTNTAEAAVPATSGIFQVVANHDDIAREALAHSIQGLYYDPYGNPRYGDLDEDE